MSTPLFSLIRPTRREGVTKDPFLRQSVFYLYFVFDISRTYVNTTFIHFESKWDFQLACTGKSNCNPLTSNTLIYEPGAPYISILVVPFYASFLEQVKRLFTIYAILSVD